MKNEKPINIDYKLKRRRFDTRTLSKFIAQTKKNTYVYVAKLLLERFKYFLVLHL